MSKCNNSLGIKISELPASVDITGEELFEIVQGGESKKATASQIQEFIQNFTVVQKEGASYVIENSDAGILLLFNRSDDIRITLPASDLSNIPANFRTWVWNHGDGGVQFITEGDDNLIGTISGRTVRGTVLGITKISSGEPNTWAVSDGQIESVPLKEIPGTAYTLTGDDNGHILIFTSGAPVSVTLPEQATEDISPGFQVGLRQFGGQVSLSVQGPGTLVNVDSHAALRGPGAVGYLYLEDDDPNRWVFGGATGETT